MNPLEMMVYFNSLSELHQMFNSGAITFKEWRIQRIMAQHAWHQ